MRAQARFRDEEWQLSFEDFQRIWQGRWDQRGRGCDDYCLTREDLDGGWTPENTICIPRLEQLRRSQFWKKAKSL